MATSQNDRRWYVYYSKDGRKWKLFYDHKLLENDGALWNCMLFVFARYKTTQIIAVRLPLEVAFQIEVTAEFFENRETKSYEELKAARGPN